MNYIISESDLKRQLEEEDGYTREQAEEMIHQGYLLWFGMAVGRILTDPATRN